MAKVPLLLTGLRLCQARWDGNSSWDRKSRDLVWLDPLSSPEPTNPVWYKPRCLTLPVSGIFSCTQWPLSNKVMWFRGCLWTHLICFCLVASLESIFSINSFPSLPPDISLSHIQNPKSPGVPSNHKFTPKASHWSASCDYLQSIISTCHFPIL